MADSAPLKKVPHLPPSPSEDEARLLAAAFLDARYWSELEGIFGGLVPAHQKIISSARQLIRDKQPVDIRTVTAHLLDAGEIEKAGGAGYIAEIGSDTDIVTEAHFRFYFERVRKAHAARKAFEISLEIQAKAEAGEDYSSDLNDLNLLAGGQLSGGFPSGVNASRWTGEEPELAPAVIEGLIRRKGKMVLGGASKSRKSWTLIQMAISISTGSEFLGLKCTRSKVLYINLELMGSEMAHRIFKVARAMDAECDNLTVLNWRGHAKDLDEMANAIIGRALEYGTEVVILDPIYKVLGERAENSNEDVAGLLNIVDMIAERAGVTFIFAHHFAKGAQGGKFVEDRISGAGAWWRDPDAGIFFTALEEDDGFQVATKARSFAAMPDFAVRAVHPLMQIDDELDPDQVRLPGRKAKSDANEMANYLLGNPLSNKEWEKLTGLAHATFTRHRDKAVERGLVVNCNGLWFHAEDAE